jgi:oligopeptidase B
LHGDVRVDDYYWLRDSSDPDVLAYLAAENDYTAASTAAARSLETALCGELRGHLQESDSSAPYLRNGYYYYSRIEAGNQYAAYCRRKGNLAADEEILLDLNALAADKPFLGLGAFTVSDDSTLLAYALDDTGYRQYTLFVRNLRTGSLLAERMERIREVVWANDSRTLVYSTEDSVTKRADSVWRRELGTAEGRLVYREPDESYAVSVERTRDGAFIMIRSEARDTSEVRFLAAARAEDEPQVFAARRDGVRYELDHRENRFYIRTNEDAPDFRIFTTPVTATGPKHWTELVGERPGTTITGMELFCDFVAVSGRRAGLASIELLVGSSTALAPVTFDESDYVIRIAENAEYVTATLRYTFESLVMPRSVYDLDVAAGRRTLVKRSAVPGYEPGAYRADRIFVTAADGTAIPVSLVSKGEPARDGTAPLLLYAYGSYGISTEPLFSAARLPLLDRGFTYAIAHVRGGGEYGEAWRLAGNLFNKRTTFSDFIDCAEALCTQGYTTRERLAIEGGSAGGLLVGAVITMRPDLCRAAIAHVPFVDVLTTMLDPLLPLTTSEYREWGNPDDPAAYAYIRSYSPLDNVGAQPYPAMLLKVALYDSQVPYWEGLKFALKLRALTTSEHVILAKVNLTAGHGGASGRYDALEERAFDIAFLLDQLGLAT